jgi:RNA polymerase sigma factor (sigma-70 family)
MRKITEKDIKGWFPRDRRFLHFCARYYGYSFHNDEVVEYANEYAIRYITKMFQEGKGFENDKHMTGIVMSSFRFAILNGYTAYQKSKRLESRPMSDYDFEGDYNSVLSTLADGSKEYDNIREVLDMIMEKELTEREREMIKRHYFQGDSLKDIVRHLEVSYTDGRRIMRNAMKKIKTVLNHEEPREIEQKDKHPERREVSKSLPKPVRNKPIDSNKAKTESYSKAMSFLYP